MPPIEKLDDQNELIDTSKYPFAHWKFEKFNPVQSRVMDLYPHNYNAIIAAATSAGKTVIAEQFMAEEVRNKKKKAMFLCPLRALAREKVNDWTNKNHHFSDLKISICTGDYRLTKERTKELMEADIIIMTSEMLNHRSRNFKAEQNSYLKDIGTLVIDEFHLLTVPGRGDHLEVGLMKFTELNPDARLVLLSATMPNVDQIAEWVSYSLTKKKTCLLASKYRPVPLSIHYESYDDEYNKYDALEEEKINKALDIIEWYKNDKFLIFAHTKRTGEKMKSALKNAGIFAEFHNADLEGAKRAEVEDRFKNDSTLRVMVATSTVAWGCNFPARRVIILGVHRGLQEVESYDILQMVGRSGRLGIDPAGDAYILVPESQAQMYRAKYSKPRRIESQLLEKHGERYKSLAFHLVSEIHHGDISTTEDVCDWYKRTFAYFQNKELDDQVIKDTLDSLKKCGAIWHENEKWTCRPIGKISSMFYFSPYDASDLFYNFKDLFENNRQLDDYHVAVALANTDTHRMGVISKIEKEEISAFANKVYLLGLKKQIKDSAMKIAYCYYNLLNGKGTQALASQQRNLQVDFLRISQVLQSLNSFTGAFSKDGYFKTLEGRIISGVPAHLVDLCQIPNIGKVRAKKLYDNGIKSVQDLLKCDQEKLKKMLNMKKNHIEEIFTEAQKIT